VSTSGDQPASASNASSELELAVPKPKMPAEVHAGGTYKHPFIDLIFPSDAGPFKRTAIIQYDEDGMDTSANYLVQTARGKVAASVYIYPVTAVEPETRYNDLRDRRLCHALFDEALTAAQSLYVKPWLREVGDAAGYFRGYRGIFDAEARIDQPGVHDVFVSRDGPLTSELYLNCEQTRSLPVGAMEIDRRWLVNYRITYPQGIDARQLVDDWIAAVPVRQPTSN
jgi:hypothetical protein